MEENGVVVVDHNGVIVHAVPYLPGGKIRSFNLVKPGSMTVLHSIEGPWRNYVEAEVDVRSKIIGYIESGKI